MSKTRQHKSSSYVEHDASDDVSYHDASDESRSTSKSKTKTHTSASYDYHDASDETSTQRNKISRQHGYDEDNDDSDMTSRSSKISSPSVFGSGWGECREITNVMRLRQVAGSGDHESDDEEEDGSDMATSRKSARKSASRKKTSPSKLFAGNNEITNLKKALSDPGGLDKRTPEEIWISVHKMLDQRPTPKLDKPEVHIDWKTIRIFISSTFTDMFYEREELVKNVFPELRTWCMNRKLRLIECDLRWGVSKFAEHDETMRICLGEIQRCYRVNKMPFFINMTSKRIGWIPDRKQVPDEIAETYNWVHGMSMTEMEILNGAYRDNNPNSLFLIRDDQFVESIPKDERGKFIDKDKDETFCDLKLKCLKRYIKDRFKGDRILEYTNTYEKCNENGEVIYKVDERLHKKVLSFFQDRISKMYKSRKDDRSKMEIQRDAHLYFMTNKTYDDDSLNPEEKNIVVGRKDILDTINNYLYDKKTESDRFRNNHPLLVSGEPGSGKTTIMAEAVRKNLPVNKSGKQGKPNASQPNVFFHFVGGIPGSTELPKMLGRLLLDSGKVTEDNKPHKLDELVQTTCSALSQDGTQPLFIFIDALNQFDAEDQHQLSWLPSHLGKNVKCVVSMVHDSQPYEMLKKRQTSREGGEDTSGNIPPENIIQVTKLKTDEKREIIKRHLGRYAKKLDKEQTDILLEKKDSSNPLWLSIACEELRVFGKFRNLDDYLNKMPPRLKDLLKHVLERYERENKYSQLLVDTVCLIEVSRNGLLESEIVKILAIGNTDYKKQKRIPQLVWNYIYKDLQPFLRPYGSSGEGRLDFYHRSISKAVRDKYLNVEVEKKYRTQIADFFTKFNEHKDLDRQIEEYPTQLIHLGDYDSLHEFLSGWDVFDKLYDKDFSKTLLEYWTQGNESSVGGKNGSVYSDMYEAYSGMLQTFRKKTRDWKDVFDRTIAVARLLCQTAEFTNETIKLGEECQELLRKHNCEKADLKLPLAQLLNTVYDIRVKSYRMISKEQTKDQLQCMKYGEESIKLLEEELKDRDDTYKYQLGKQYVKLAFTLASYRLQKNNVIPWMGKMRSFQMPWNKTEFKERSQQGIKYCEKAQIIFEGFEGRYNGDIAEALMTKAVLTDDVTEKIELMKEADTVCVQFYGPLHGLRTRIAINLSDAYRTDGNNTEAYTWYKRAYTIAKDVYGPAHQLTKDAREVFSKDPYKSIAKRNNETYLYT